MYKILQQFNKFYTTPTINFFKSYNIYKLQVTKVNYLLLNKLWLHLKELYNQKFYNESKFTDLFPNVKAFLISPQKSTPRPYLKFFSKQKTKNPEKKINKSLVLVVLIKATKACKLICRPIKYTLPQSVKTHNFIRKTKFYTKTKMPRNRQICKNIVLLGLALNILFIVLGQTTLLGIKYHVSHVYIVVNLFALMISFILLQKLNFREIKKNF